MSGEVDQTIVLLLSEHGSHIEHVLEHGLLQLALCTMNFLHGGFYAFRIAFCPPAVLRQVPDLPHEST
jgi:hypothetical protein